ncbi:spermidine synthase family protein [Salinactinospora qingdaonensis]|uniref:Spermidine synthase n=1 Tax=Salinactinospora qingdaonensis TaxID=702744 RepID=A0ABP7F829_9ACTN
MSIRFQELDWRETPMGVISLRRRRDPLVDKDVYEIKLDDEFLMSSLFTVAEVEIARLALSGMDGENLNVAVGGLGLGYTAQTVLESPNVDSVVVVEALGEVIEWHERGLIPAGVSLTADPRCRFVQGDFFSMVASTPGLDPHAPNRRFDAIIVDIDHSPRHLLHPSHADFYQPGGLRALADQLTPGGTFALWSNDPPDADFTTVLTEVFDQATAETVSFHNPLCDDEAANTVYLATTSAA